MSEISKLVDDNLDYENEEEVLQTIQNLLNFSIGRVNHFMTLKNNIERLERFNALQEYRF